jgi:hypothetical protein
MSLINIGSVRSQVLRLLDKIDPPGGIELLSYKRNRSVAILCCHDGDYFVLEKGYAEQELAVDQDQLPRLLKTVIKRVLLESLPPGRRPLSGCAVNLTRTATTLCKGKPGLKLQHILKLAILRKAWHWR